MDSDQSTNCDRAVRFRRLYTSAYADVLRFAQRRVHPTHAEDVAADAFLIAWRRLDDAPAQLDDQRAWLFGIARNCLLNARRGQGRREALAVRLADQPPTDLHDPGTDADADLIARRVDLAAAWRQLSAAHQEVLSLAVFEDLSSARAGTVLGISATAYRLRLLRARRALRSALSPADSPSVLMEAQS